MISLADRLPPSPSTLHRASHPAKVYNIIRKIVKYITRRSRTMSVWHPWNNRNDRGEGLLLLMSTGYFFEWLWFVLPFPSSVTFSSSAVTEPFVARVCVTRTQACKCAEKKRTRASLHAYHFRLVLSEGLICVRIEIVVPRYRRDVCFCLNVWPACTRAPARDSDCWPLPSPQWSSLRRTLII